MIRNIGTLIVLIVLFMVSTIRVVDPNVISNPGFELGTTSWNFYTRGTGMFTMPSPDIEGNNFAKIALTSSGGNIQLF